MSLKDIKLVLHLLVDVVEALLRRVVVGVLPFFMRERGYHRLVVLLDLQRKVVLGRQTLVFFGRALRSDLPNGVHVLVGRMNLYFLDRFGLLDRLFEHFFVGLLGNVLVNGLDLMHVGAVRISEHLRRVVLVLAAVRGRF